LIAEPGDGTITPVTRHRLLIVLVALGLAAASAPGTARAHLGRDQVDEAPRHAIP
jgi:hypothetical protein